jgi:hypothetical protein
MQVNSSCMLSENRGHITQPDSGRDAGVRVEVGGRLALEILRHCQAPRARYARRSI